MTDDEKCDLCELGRGLLGLLCMWGLYLWRGYI